MTKHFIKILTIIIICIFFVSCENKDEINIETVEETTYVPLAKNYYAINEVDDSIVEDVRGYRIYNDLPTPNSDITISEDWFLTQIDNIYRKIDEYADKTITVEGMFGHYKEWDGSFESYMVYRNGPNDYNNDIFGGFFINNLKGENISIDDWIQVVGKPYVERKLDSDGVEHKYLFLQVKNLQIMPENKRGAEFVVN